MTGTATPVRATAVATNVSTEGVALFLPYSGGDSANIATTLIGPPATAQLPNVEVTADLNVTAGTGTTAVVVRCRRGNGTGGTQVGTSRTVTLAAGNTDDVSVSFLDPSAPVQAGYSVTIQQTGGTGAGTVNEIIATTGTYQ